MKELILLGSNGMFGLDATPFFEREGYRVHCGDLPGVDITDRSFLGTFLDAHPAPILVNAAAYTDVDGAEEEEARARQVNVEGLRNIVRACRDRGIFLVHISSDYVFPGKKPEGYLPTDEPGPPVNRYGRSKLDGESLIREGLPPHQYLICRTQWLYGRHGRNFVDTILALSSERERIRVVDDQWGVPTHTLDLARQMIMLLKEGATGIRHLVGGGGPVTWRRVAEEIVRISGVNCEVTPCSSEEFPRPAARPRYGWLKDPGAPADSVRPWTASLRFYIESLTEEEPVLSLPAARPEGRHAPVIEEPDESFQPALEQEFQETEPSQEEQPWFQPPVGSEPVETLRPLTADEETETAYEPPAAGPRTQVLTLEEKAAAGSAASSIAAGSKGWIKRFWVLTPLGFGVLALSLALISMINHYYHEGLLTALHRIIIGVGFGTILLLAGDVLRKTLPIASVAMSVSGIGGFYACCLFAVMRYNLISSEAGTGLLGLISTLAVVLSLRQAGILAPVGLLGGTLSPFLLKAAPPETLEWLAPLVFFQVSLLVVGRLRRWWLLPLMSLVSAAIWMSGWLFYLYRLDQTLLIGGFTITYCSSFLLVGWISEEGKAWNGPRLTLALNWAAGALGLSLTSALVVWNRYGWQGWAFLGAQGLLCLIIARMDRRFESLAWCAQWVTLTLLLILGSFMVPAGVTYFLFLCGGAWVLYTLPAYAFLWGTERSLMWSSMAAFSATSFFVAGYLGQSKVGGPFPWGSLAVVLAVVFGLASAFAVKGLTRRGGEANNAAVLFASAASFLLLSIPMELGREWLSAAWALAIPGFIWASVKMGLPVFSRIAWLLTALVPAYIALHSILMRYPENIPMWAWVFYWCGLPIVAYCLAAFLARRYGDVLFAELLETGAVVLTGYLLWLEVRQAFQPRSLFEPTLHFVESGWLTVALSALGLAAAAASVRWMSRSLYWSGIGMLALGLTMGIYGSLYVVHPFWRHVDVGAIPVFNWLLLVYGVPSMLYFAAAFVLLRTGRIWPSRFFGLAGLSFFFLMLSFEIRQFFQGSFLDGESAPLSEKYAYTIAWVAFGSTLAFLANRYRGLVLPLSSIAVMLMTVCKVFLYDLTFAHMRGLYLSFSLLTLALYMFLLFVLFQSYQSAGRTEHEP